MSDVMTMPQDVVETPDGEARGRTEPRRTPGTWEDQVLTFAGCYALEETARRDMREETRQPTGRRSERDVTRGHVAELLTVASAVETFLEGYLKSQPRPPPRHCPVARITGPVAGGGREGGMTVGGIGLQRARACVLQEGVVKLIHPEMVTGRTINVRV